MPAPERDGKGGRRDGLVSAQSKPGQSLRSKEIFAAPPISASSTGPSQSVVCCRFPASCSMKIGE
jgi:hypothetical protein